MGEPCCEEATERFRELAGDRVRIEFGSRSEERYGRILFYVYTDAGGERVGAVDTRGCR